MNDFFKTFMGKDNGFGDIFNEIFGDKVNPINPSERVSTEKPNNHTTQKPKNRKFNSEKTDDGTMILKVPVPKLMSVFDVSLKFDPVKSIIRVIGDCPSGFVDKEYKVNKQIEKIVFHGIEYEHAIIRFHIRKNVPIYGLTGNSEQKVDV